MARFTLDQIKGLIPDETSYLQQKGITQRMGDDGTPVYFDSEGNRVSPGQIDEIRNGSDFGLAGRQALDKAGVIDTSFFSGLSPYMQGKYGDSIKTADDYMNHLYGGQGERVGDYWVLPEGMQTSQYTNSPFTNDSPDDKMTQMMPYLIAAGAMAGLGGFLPGTESVFGGAGAGAGAGAGVEGAGATAGASGAANTSWLTGGLAPNAGIGGVGTAGLGLTAPTAAGGGLGLIAPTAMAGGATAAAGGFGDFVTGLLGKSGIGAGDILKGGLNYLINQGQAGDLKQAGLDASAASNPLNAPQRQTYQQQLLQLLQNPSTFYSTNPAVKGQLDLARQQFEANSAKMGVGGTQFNDYLKNVQNIASGTYNDQANLLAQLGGFTFPGGNSATTAYQGASDAAKYSSESFRGFGGIADKLFSGINKLGSGGSSNEFSLG